MANMNFGVNLLPKTDNTYSLGIDDGNSNQKRWIIYASEIHGPLTGNASSATTATNLSAAPTITQAGSSGTTLSAATFYTLTVGGQTVVFKTPTDTNDKVTQNVKTDNKKYGIILSNYETSASTTTAATVNRDSKVYVNPSLNSINAGQFVLHDKAATPVEKAYMVWNATDLSIDFVFN